MTSADRYRAALQRLGLTILGAGRYFGVSPRTARRWAEEGPPDSVMLCLTAIDFISGMHAMGGPAAVYELAAWAAEEWQLSFNGGIKHGSVLPRRE